MSNASVGKHGFITQHYLWNAEQRAAAKDVEQHLASADIQVLRLSFVDQHGLLRGKSLTGPAMLGALSNGCTITTTLLLKDTSHRTVFPVWQAEGDLASDALHGALRGAADSYMVADPLSFKVLPWAPNTAWMLCDLYYPDGQPLGLSTRHQATRLTSTLAEQGYQYRSGLEIEFHVYRVLDPKLAPADATMPGNAPEVGLLTQGFQYLTESRLDELEPTLELIRSTLQAFQLPLRSMEVEFGPSQVELTFDPGDGLSTADNTILARSAIKQVCARHGLHATFMCRPAIDNALSSGWHLHQSLISAGVNAFMPSAAARAGVTSQTDSTAVLSSVGHEFVAGLLAHASAACAFTTPTINGYKRFKAYSLAPDRANWGCDNRGVMVRAIGGVDDPNTRIENRIGEPCANPYLYLVSQLVSGMQGMSEHLQPPATADAPYDTPAPALPRSLMQATDALDKSAAFRSALGDEFIDYFVHIKRAEIDRFLSEVTDWEQREYFRMF